ASKPSASSRSLAHATALAASSEPDKRLGARVHKLSRISNACPCAKPSATKDWTTASPRVVDLEAVRSPCGVASLLLWRSKSRKAAVAATIGSGRARRIIGAGYASAFDLLTTGVVDGLGAVRKLPRSSRGSRRGDARFPQWISARGAGGSDQSRPAGLGPRPA